MLVQKNAIKLYPIPGNGQLTISKRNDVIGDIKIYDIQGRLLHTQHIELNSATIDISKFSAGVYILRTNKATVRFVVD